MLNRFFAQLKSVVAPLLGKVRNLVLEFTKPLNETLVGGIAHDAPKTKTELLTENALLRQQLIVLNCQVKRPKLEGPDRFVLVMLASKLRPWRRALLIIKPETLLGWHRELFRLVWKHKSAASSRKPRVPSDTIALIRRMAFENKLWGAERIQGELLKLNIKLAKRTIQKYMRAARPSRSSGQTWATFLNNHASQIWSCDFLPVVDVSFRQLYAFFIVEHQSRRVVHVGVTRHPTDAWVAQQLREATPFGEHPKYLICDNDSKFGSQFSHVAAGAGIKILKTPFHAPKANAICERFLGSVRRECLDHFLIFSEHHLRRVLQEYVAYFNLDRPHQGINQQIPIPRLPEQYSKSNAEPIQSLPILHGLHITIIGQRPKIRSVSLKNTKGCAIGPAQLVVWYVTEVMPKWFIVGFVFFHLLSQVEHGTSKCRQLISRRGWNIDGRGILAHSHRIIAQCGNGVQCQPID